MLIHEWRQGAVSVRIFDLGGGGANRTTHSRIMTLPNVVTLLRLLAVPFIVIALRDGRFTTALVLLLVFASTDWIDGFLARALDQVSQFGALFDPAVDRVFIIAVAFGLLTSEVAPLWAVLVVVLRDAGVLVLAGILLLRGTASPPVSKLGKFGSFAVMAAAFSVVAAEVADGRAEEVWRAVGYSLFLLGVTAGYLAVIGYARALRSPVQ
jgi:cardiolipin synthase (CMP-forming)